ncbi:aldo/keto reductase [Rhodovulum sp. YNF3179]|uniref:aldo/keto reductase n=1 Tax=Rhodovulum sp. YNF3179 TaxID=3425127 RepID=UPI003D32F2B5
MIDALPLARTRRIGPFEVGRIGYGCWRFAGTPVAAAREKLETALAAGIDLIDTAAIYGFGETAFGEAEERLGDALADAPGLREKIVLVTKGGIVPPIPYDSRKAALIESVEASLRRLRTEAVDLFLVHRPDFLAAHAEVGAALEEMHAAGKIRAAGVSNYTVAQTRALQAQMDLPLVATQPEFSALEPAPLYDGVLDLAQETGLAPMAWSPLGGGALATGQGGPAPAARRDAVLAEIDRIAGRNGCGRDVVALAWVLAHPAAPVALIGTQRPARIRAAMRAFDVRLTRRDWYAVLEARLGEAMP